LRLLIVNGIGLPLKEWNASDDFFVVSDMGSYYNVYEKHKYATVSL
jgi:hypothetical protein